MEQRTQWLENDSEDRFDTAAKVHPENHPGAEDDYPEDDPTLDEYFEEWIERKRKTAGKPATPYRYNQVYRNHISRWLGERKIRQIRRRDVTRLQTDLLDTIGPKMVNYVIQLLKQILNDAVLDEIIAKNPAANIRRLKNTGAEDFVFPSSTGRVLHNATANNALERIQKRMAADGSQVPHFSAHALRDTFATRFIEQGGTPQTLKTLLGHSSLKMTMDLYAHVLPNTRKKEMDMVVILP